MRSLLAKTSAAAFFMALVGGAVSAPSQALAQDVNIGNSVTMTTSGVSGDEDKFSRNPTLTVTHQIVNESATEPSRVKLLVDAYTVDDTFSKYPLRFDFFVNRKLFSTQIRSPELPGAVGVDIGTDIASPPFNYTVVATVLHPNRSFTTVLNGAVFSSDLIRKLDCSVTKPAATEGAEDVFTASSVDSLQKGNDTIALKYNANGAGGSLEDEIVVDLTLAEVPSTSQSGDISISGTISTTGGGKDVAAEVEGTATFTNGALTGLEVASGDDVVSLSCSEAAAE
jgi:hypothetical protein